MDQVAAGGCCAGSADRGGARGERQAVARRGGDETDPRPHEVGDLIAIAAYLGGSAAFDEAIAEFASVYADQNERDYASLGKAVSDGKITAARAAA